MTSPSVLDHLIYLAPVGQLSKSIARFRTLGFNVIPGGTHADGLTANALVVLPSGVYLELIHFVKTPEETGPPGSPERKAREHHWWAHLEPGWIDWALLGRPGKHAEQVYNEPQPGGRTREDGEKLEWNVTFPKVKYPRGTVPFYCEDVTPRERRVPVSTDSHDNDVARVSRLILAVPIGQFHELTRVYVSILGAEPEGTTNEEIWFRLEAPHGVAGSTLVLRSRDDVHSVNTESVYMETSSGNEIHVV